MALSMSTRSIATDIGTAVMSKILDTVEETGEALTEMIDAVIPSDLGQFIDVRA